MASKRKPDEEDEHEPDDVASRPKRERRLTERGRLYEESLKAEGGDGELQDEMDSDSDAVMHDAVQDLHSGTQDQPTDTGGAGDSATPKSAAAGPPAHTSQQTVAGKNSNFDLTLMQDWFKEARLLMAEMRQLRDEMKQKAVPDPTQQNVNQQQQQLQGPPPQQQQQAPPQQTIPPRSGPSHHQVHGKSQFVTRYALNRNLVPTSGTACNLPNGASQNNNCNQPLA